MALKKRKRFLKSSIAYSFVFIAAVLAYVLVINFSPLYRLVFLQNILAKTIFLIQDSLGIDVVLKGSSLAYGEFKINIDILCTGIYEILFFTALIFAFIGVSIKTKVKGVAYFAPLIIIENLIRILMIYPLAFFFSEATAFAVHNVIYKYLQAVFVLALVLIWFMLYAKEEFTSSLKKHSRGKGPRKR